MGSYLCGLPCSGHLKRMGERSVVVGGSPTSPDLEPTKLSAHKSLDKKSQSSDHGLRPKEAGSRKYKPSIRTHSLARNKPRIRAGEKSCPAALLSMCEEAGRVALLLVTHVHQQQVVFSKRSPPPPKSAVSGLLIQLESVYNPKVKKTTGLGAGSKFVWCSLASFPLDH